MVEKNCLTFINVGGKKQLLYVRSSSDVGFLKMFMNETCKYTGFPYDRKTSERVALTYFRLSVTHHLHSIFRACSHNGKLPPILLMQEKWNQQELHIEDKWPLGSPPNGKPSQGVNIRNCRVSQIHRVKYRGTNMTPVA